MSDRLATAQGRKGGGGGGPARVLRVGPAATRTTAATNHLSCWRSTPGARLKRTITPTTASSIIAGTLHPSTTSEIAVAGSSQGTPLIPNGLTARLSPLGLGRMTV